MALPKFKITDVPRVERTSPEEAYYGAQKQRTRRSAKVGLEMEKFKKGKIGFGDFKDVLGRITQRAVGMPERAGFEEVGLGAQQMDYERQDVEQAQAYERGLLDYEEYRNYLQASTARYAEETAARSAAEDVVTELDYQKASQDVTELTGMYNRGELTYRQYMNQLEDVGALLSERVQPEVDIPEGFEGLDDLKLGDTTFGEFVAEVQEDFNVQEQARLAAEWAAGTLAFEDYATFLEGELNKYTKNSQKSKQLSAEWKKAYAVELENFYGEMAAQTGEAGPIWEQFNTWYAKQIKKGPKKATKIKPFTGKVEGEKYPITKKLKDLKDVQIPKTMKGKGLGILQRDRNNTIEALKAARKAKDAQKVKQLTRKRNRLTKAILQKKR